MFTCMNNMQNQFLEEIKELKNEVYELKKELRNEQDRNIALKDLYRKGFHLLLKVEEIDRVPNHHARTFRGVLADVKDLGGGYPMLYQREHWVDEDTISRLNDEDFLERLLWDECAVRLVSEYKTLKGFKLLK